MTRFRTRTQTGPQRLPRRIVRYVWLALALFGLDGMASASEYPPPPGPYQSEPLEFPAVTPPDAREATPVDTAPTGTSSRMLPLPGGSGATSESPYSAANLFGSAPEAAPAPVEVPDPAAAGPAAPGPTAAQVAATPGQQVAPATPRRSAASAPGYGAGPYPPQAPSGYPAHPSFPGYRPYPGRLPGAPSGTAGQTSPVGAPAGPATGYPAGSFRDPGVLPAPLQDADEPRQTRSSRPPAGHPGPVQDVFVPPSRRTPGLGDPPPRAQAPPFQPPYESWGGAQAPSAPAVPADGEALFRPTELSPER